MVRLSDSAIYILWLVQADLLICSSRVVCLKFDTSLVIIVWKTAYQSGYCPSGSLLTVYVCR